MSSPTYEPERWTSRRTFQEQHAEAQDLLATFSQSGDPEEHALLAYYGRCMPWYGMMPDGLSMGWHRHHAGEGQEVEIGMDYGSCEEIPRRGDNARRADRASASRGARATATVAADEEEVRSVYVDERNGNGQIRWLEAGAAQEGERRRGSVDGWKPHFFWGLALSMTLAIVLALLACLWIVSSEIARGER